VGGPAAARLADARGYIVSEAPADGIDSVPGAGADDRVYLNDTYTHLRDKPVDVPGQNLALYFGPYLSGWAYNCTVQVDVSQVGSNFGAGFAWYYGNGAPVNVRLENCRFEMIGADHTTANFLQTFNTPAGPNLLLSNDVIVFTGSQPAGLGPARAAGALDHNAYYFPQAVPPGYLDVDPGAVVLARPPAPGAPSLAGPLRGAGAANGLGYDQDCAPRPAGAADIGPLIAAPLPAPAAVAAAWVVDATPVSRKFVVSGAGVNRLTLTFAADVDVYPASLALIGGAEAVGGFAYDPATHAATWTLAAPLAAGQYALAQDGRVVWKFAVLPGDYTHDGRVSGDDLKRIRAAYGTADPSADVNGDGVVDDRDYAIALQYFGTGI
jgi:hypothetical protein